MLLQFYRDVLPEQGQYCLFVLPERKHYWASSLAALEAGTNKLGQRPNLQLYFATASFVGREGRTQANVQALRSLRLDVDAGPAKYARSPNKVYPDQRQALAATVQFCKGIGVAPTYIVSSGEGLHLYFCLDADATPEQWLPLAGRLSELCEEHEFLADSAVTKDTARVLRPLGSLHKNGSTVSVLKYQPKAIYDLAWLSSKLGVRPKRMFDMSVNEDLRVQGPPSDAFKIIKHCGALNEVAVSRGDVAEPHWRAMIGLVKHTTGGLNLVHEWSSGYDGYDADETDEKFNRYQAGPTTCAEFSRHSTKCASCPHNGRIKTPLVLGYMTADEIEQLPPEQQPAPAPAPAPQGRPWDGKIPPRFKVTESDYGPTLVYLMEMQKESPTGETVPVEVPVPFTHEVFWFGQWASAGGTDDTAQVVINKLEEGQVRRFLMGQELLASRSDLLKYLAGKAIHLTTHKKAADAMDAYVKAQMLRVRSLSKRPKVLDHFGMRVLEDGTLACAHGKYVINQDGSIQEAMLSQGLRSTADAYPLPVPPSPDGSWGQEVWSEAMLPKARKYVDFVRRHYNKPGLEKYQLALMLGLASPLMAFVKGGFTSGAALPPNGLSVSLYSRQGGRGKTTLMDLVQLAYGNPDQLGGDRNTVGSTDLARVARLSMAGTMPVSMDEMGEMSASNGRRNVVSELIRTIANGSGRERATKDGGLMQGSKWALTCLISTNKSQREMIAAGNEESDAVQHRLLELDVGDMPDFSADEQQQFRTEYADLLDTAGAFGAVIHREICRLGVAKANELVLRCVDAASKQVEVQAARFQYRGLGALMALHALLARIDMHLFDLKGLVAAFRSAHDDGLAFIQDRTLPTDGLEVLSMFLHDIRPHTIVTEAETRRTGTVAKYDLPIGLLPAEARARYIVGTSRFYVQVGALRDWCLAKSVSEAELLRAANTHGVLQAIRGSQIVAEGGALKRKYDIYNIYRGMKESTSTNVPCYCFSLKKMAEHLGTDVDEFIEIDADEPVTRIA